ncbi:MAG: DUF47 domain-containing protein [Brumimicrobium sp.]|nr:DUF47 domain-containing protein [Brumimicrobium sp.]
MGLNKFFHSFQPKSKVFYALFDQVTENLNKMSNRFAEGIQNFEKMDNAFLDEMQEFEHINDDLTHEIYVELNKNFITPFDREDIHLLASRLDDIADYMFAATKHIVLYKSPYVEGYKTLTHLIVESCSELKVAINELKSLESTDKIKHSCIKINAIENQADDALSEAMVALFENHEAINVIKISSIIQYLEEVTDKAEEVANVIQGILIKYT